MKIAPAIRELVRMSGFDVVRYRPLPHPLNFIRAYKIKTVIDVGANVGEFIASVRAVLPTVDIVALEPQPSCASIILNRFSGDTHLRVLECAIGDSNRSQEFTLNTYSPSASLRPLSPTHKEAFSHAQEGSNITVSVRTLDSIIEEQGNGLQGPFFVKLDIQGYELQAIQGAESLLALTKIALIESSFVELYQGQALFREILQAMERRGFQYHGSTTTKYHPETRLPLFEDALFIRE